VSGEIVASGLVGPHPGRGAHLVVLAVVVVIARVLFGVNRPRARRRLILHDRVRKRRGSIDLEKRDRAPALWSSPCR
jgi:hypothetical protein